mgnify:CR=1 FL=1
MAKIRFGYSDDFTAKDSGVGINTTQTQKNLEVVGVTKGEDLTVSGISSFTAYEGFQRSEYKVAEVTTLKDNQGRTSSLSKEIIVGTGQTVTVNEIVKDTAGVGNGSDNQWNDLNGNYAFKKNGDPTWDGSAFVYDGAGDYHSLSGGDTDTFEVANNNFTLEQWVNITAVSSICGTFFSKGNDNSVGSDFISLQTKSNNTIPAFFFRDGSALLEGSAVGTGEWHHYVVTRSGNNFTLYVDGTSVDTATNVGTLSSGITGGINIGAQSYSVSTDGRKLNGKISITRLYSGTVLTAGEVTTNYNAGYTATGSVVTPTVDLNANVPASYPGTTNTVETTDATRSGGSEVECLKVYNSFMPPSGGTNDRPYAPKAGQIFYNYDIRSIEFFDGDDWRQVDSGNRASRAYFSGGARIYPSSVYNKTIDLVNLQSTGGAVEFGEFDANTMGWHASCSSATRAVAGGTNSPATDTLEYWTLTSGGKAADFGDQETQRYGAGGASSSTRGVFAGGWSPSGVANTNVIDYIEISTKGSAKEFGDLVHKRRYMSATSNGTRAVWMGGIAQPVDNRTEIDYATISSTGDAVDFGDCAGNASQHAGCSNSVRGVGAYAAVNAGENTRFHTIIIASTGDAIDFGYLDSSRYVLPGFACDNTRGVYAGGFQEAPSVVSVTEMDMISMAFGGAGIDFGDLTVRRSLTSGCSDSHGGLGGF